jgi:hypothetical protein
VSPSDRAVFQEVAKLLSLGRDVGQIAQSTDLQASFLEALLLREDFLGFFEAERPAEFTVWRKARDEEQASEQAQHFLQSKVVHNVRRMQAIADGGDLKPSEEASLRKDLVKMSGVVKEEASNETVRISSAHLAALLGAASEVD